MSKYKDLKYIKIIEDFNEVIFDDWTHFHHICRYNSSNLEVIKYCVEHGAEFNIKNNYGNISFCFVCCNKTTKEVLEYCLDNSADLTIEDNYKWSPFYYLCKHNKDLIPVCKQYMNEYDYIKTLKKCDLNWKEYV